MSKASHYPPPAGQPPFFWVFSPFQTDPELLEAIFTGRENLLQDVISKVTQSALTAAKHYILLYGPRGIGKTNFLALLNHRLRHNEEIRDKIRIAILNEDEISASFAQFLMRIYRSLALDYPAEFPASRLELILDMPLNLVAPALTQEIIDRLGSHSLILFIENLDIVFKTLGREGQHALRSFLTNHQKTAVVATSQQLSDEFNDREGPFYGFFRQVALKPFSADDAHELLKKLASLRNQLEMVAYLQSPEGRARVRAIHHLAGGNQRVYMVLSSLVTPESLDHLVAPFQKLADELTPYYQERIWSLPTIQRTIIQEFCRSPQALSPSAMARRLVADEKTIGKQMNLLEERHYLTKTTRGRESFYELTEPLMRISFEVKERKLLELLVAFLRCWYDPRPTVDISYRGIYETAKDDFDADIEQNGTSPDPRLKKLDEEIEKAATDGRVHGLAKILEEKAVVTQKTSDFDIAGYYYATTEKNETQAIDCFEHAIDIDPDDAYAWLIKGILVDDLKRYEEAVACYDRALEIDPEFVDALYNKGILMKFLKRYEEALDCYDRALGINPNDTSVWNNKGCLLQILKRDQEAFFCLDRAIEINPLHPYPRYNKTEYLFALDRCPEAFDLLKEIRDKIERKDWFGDVAIMLAIIFEKSADPELLRQRFEMLFDHYEQLDKKTWPGGKPATSPVNWFGEGLVKSLAKLDPGRFTRKVLENYVAVAEAVLGPHPRMELPLRLFRYGVQYLIRLEELKATDPRKLKETPEKMAEAVLVELVRPEREILRQALGLVPMPT